MRKRDSISTSISHYSHIALTICFLSNNKSVMPWTMAFGQSTPVTIPFAKCRARAKKYSINSMGFKLRISHFSMREPVRAGIRFRILLREKRGAIYYAFNENRTECVWYGNRMGCLKRILFNETINRSSRSRNWVPPSNSLFLIWCVSIMKDAIYIIYIYHFDRW